MMNFVRTSDVNQQARIFLAANILLMYCVTVVAVVLAIDHFKPSLYDGDYFTFPNILMMTVWFMYYGAPFVLAIIYGLLFRPFWQSFRNLLIAILTIQVLASFVFCMFRWDYLTKFQNQNKWRKTDKIKVSAMVSEYADLNEDGFLDQLTVSSTFNFARIRMDEYVLHAVLVPTDVPFTIDGGGLFKITTRNTALNRRFVIAPRTDSGADVSRYVSTAFKIKFILFRVVSVDDKGKALLRWTRWSPYFRATRWDGGDPQIYGDMILLDTLTTSESFSLPAPAMGTDKN